MELRTHNTYKLDSLHECYLKKEEEKFANLCFSCYAFK